MNNVNKTLYIPLYGKAYVSKRGIILRDKTAEEIWAKEGFPLRGRSKSKWLCFYMGMRSAVFDRWLKRQIAVTEKPVIIHIGCGMDSRAVRVAHNSIDRYDVDFPDVIAERRRYYRETEHYHMIAADVRDTSWLDEIPASRNALVVMEGVSMYLSPKETVRLLRAVKAHFSSMRILIDFYTKDGAKLSAIRNPINDVGVTKVYGIDDPEKLARHSGLSLVGEHSMTPRRLIAELSGAERLVFSCLYAGKMSRKMYRLYEFKS